MKSELHLNQDGVATAPRQGHPAREEFVQQMIGEVKPNLVITAGTAGAVFGDHELGDVIVTRGAKFRLRKEFKNETFADTAYKCDTFTIPSRQAEGAKTLLAKHADRLKEPDFGPPTRKLTNGPGRSSPASSIRPISRSMASISRRSIRS